MGKGWRIWVEGAVHAPHKLPPDKEIQENAGEIWEAVWCRRLGTIPRLLFPLQEDSRNYLTLVGQYGDGLLVCGTGACAPTCWNVVRILPPSRAGKTRPDPTQDPFLSFPRHRGKRARPGMGEGSLHSPLTQTPLSLLMVSGVFSHFPVSRWFCCAQSLPRTNRSPLRLLQGLCPLFRVALAVLILSLWECTFLWDRG